MMMDTKGIALSQEASRHGYSVGVFGTGDQGQQGGIALIVRFVGVDVCGP